MVSRFLRTLSGAAAALLTGVAPAAPPGSYSLRFHGNGLGAPEQDRVVIALEPSRPVDVGAGDFTLEFWIKALPGDNDDGFTCDTGNDSWIYGTIVFDRDVWGPGDHGDFGVSLAQGRIAFGTNDGSSGATACGARDVADGEWHHVALTRSADGGLNIFVDGQLDGAALGPGGDISYRDGRPPSRTYDSSLVIGTEKHDAVDAGFQGWIDEVRVSTSLRYASTFVPLRVPFTSDEATAALYHFDEGSGDVAADASGALGGPSEGRLLVGGSPPGPEWSADSPLTGLTLNP